MSADPEVSARIDHLLRTDARLCDAAPLIGRIPAIVTEPKPERKPRKRRAGKKPPPRVDVGEDAADLDERADDEDEAVVPTGLPPWLKVARAKTVSPQMRAALGAEALAYVAIDGALWERLSRDLQDRALILAIRPLVWSERKADGGDVVRRTQPPLQCHPDTAGDLSELVAALTDDPEEAATGSAAAEVMAWMESRAAASQRHRNLETSVVSLDENVECLDCGGTFKGGHGACIETDVEGDEE